MKALIVVVVCLSNFMQAVYPLECYNCTESNDGKESSGGPCLSVTTATQIISSNGGEGCNLCYLLGQQFENGTYQIGRGCFTELVFNDDECNEKFILEPNEKSCECETDKCNGIPIQRPVPTTTTETSVQTTTTVQTNTAETSPTTQVQETTTTPGKETTTPVQTTTTVQTTTAETSTTRQTTTETPGQKTTTAPGQKLTTEDSLEDIICDGTDKLLQK